MSASHHTAEVRGDIPRLHQQNRNKTLLLIVKTHEVISKAKTELWHRLLTHYLPLFSGGRTVRRQLPQRLVP